MEMIQLVLAQAYCTTSSLMDNEPIFGMKLSFSPPPPPIVTAICLAPTTVSERPRSSRNIGAGGGRVEEELAKPL